MGKEMLHDRVIELINHNESLYDRWESNISALIAKKWPAAFELTKENSGDENPTVTIIADIGSDSIDDPNAFISDLEVVFRTLAKGGQLNSNGEWC
jgi:hypothetical protein